MQDGKVRAGMAGFDILSSQEIPNIRQQILD
jgi:hypothetical protein